jgi:radical SAM superfamily enzyme YgiQ (UPF0313 family)
MKALFIQNFWQPFLGTCYISSKIKSAGHSCSLIIQSKIDDRLLKEIQKENPQVIAFSVMTSSLHWTLSAAKYIKNNFPEMKIILGGIHPTICPEVIEDESVDVICRGEGELPFSEFLSAMETGIDYSSTPNLWIKSKKGIIKNEIRHLIQDLDSLPFPDRSLYFDKYPFLANFESKAVLIGRGCPYPCTFCINNTLMQLHSGKGKFIRRRNPDKVIEEIKSIQEKYTLKHIYFNDDTFTLNIHYLEEFLNKYRKNFSIPFTCGSRADLVTPRLVKILKESGCYCVEMGVECGNEDFRYSILKKKITDEEIINAANLIKGAGIYLKTSNMTGLPGETLDIAFQTIELNRKIKADFVNCSLLQPYPKLEITELAFESGYLNKNFDFSTLEGMSYSKNPIAGKDTRKLRNLQKFFLLCIKFKWLEPAVKILINFPANFIFDIIFEISFAFNYSKYHKISLKQVAKFAFLGRKNY